MNVKRGNVPINIFLGFNIAACLFIIVKRLAVFKVMRPNELGVVMSEAGLSKRLLLRTPSWPNREAFLLNIKCLNIFNLYYKL